MSLYDVLGVAPGASPEEIRRAWLARAKRLHPDVHPNAPTELRRELEREMAEVNHAYEVLADPERRAAYDRRLARDRRSSSREAPPPYREPGPEECWVCGGSPAAAVRFRQESGRLLWRVRRWIDGPFCRTCGTAVFRTMTDRTLLTGWWGLISFFQNLATIAGNVAAYAKVRRLGLRRPNPGYVLSLSSAPLDPGRPLWARAGLWLGVPAGLLVAALAVGAALGGGREGTAGDSRPALETGTCVTFTRDGGAGVPCDEPHDAVVIDVVARPTDCPILATDYTGLRGDGEVVCLALR